MLGVLPFRCYVHSYDWSQLQDIQRPQNIGCDHDQFLSLNPLHGYCTNVDCLIMAVYGTK